MSRKDLSVVKKYGISKAKYRELMYFCMQYHEMKDKIEYGMHSIDADGQPHGNSIGSPTETQAIQNEQCAHSIHIIEESAKEASPELWKYILQSVTDGTAYDYMDVPCGKNQFYNHRRKFFYRLSLKR